MVAALEIAGLVALGVVIGGALVFAVVVAGIYAAVGRGLGW